MPGIDVGEVIEVAEAVLLLDDLVLDVLLMVELANPVELVNLTVVVRMEVDRMMVVLSKMAGVPAAGSRLWTSTRTGACAVTLVASRAAERVTLVEKRMVDRII